MKALVRHSIVLGTGCALAVMGASAALAQNGGGAASQPETQGAQRTIQLVQARAELSKTLDAKKAKQGDAVTAKLEESVKIPDEQELPRNTVLEGHVDQVMPSEHKSESTLTVTFDKAKLKSGKEVPIKVTVIAVSEPALSAMEAGGGGPGGAPGGAPMATPGGGPGGASGPGGAGGASPMPAQQPSMNMPDASGNPGSPSQAKRTGVPGVTLTSDIHQKVSATFTSQGRNVHVPGGTQMQLALAIIPAGVQMQ